LLNSCYDPVTYREIGEDSEAGILSYDLKNVKLRCQEWGLKLNLCKYTTVHLLQKPLQHITSDISWGKQKRNICGTALKKLRFIKCVVGRYSEEKVKGICYYALVRPHLAYAASIWDPGHKYLIRRLNKT
jgi:hypothetical protein